MTVPVHRKRHEYAASQPVQAEPQASQASQAQPSEMAPTVLPASLPLKRDADASTGIASIPIAMLSGIILLGALLIAIRFYISKKRGGGKGMAGMQTGWFGSMLPRTSIANPQIVSSAQLSRGGHLHVIEWRGCQYLLAGNEHAFTLLERVPDPSGKASPVSLEKFDLPGGIA